MTAHTDPLCYVTQDPLLDAVFHDGCRVCDLLARVRADERRKITEGETE